MAKMCGCGGQCGYGPFSPPCPRYVGDAAPRRGDYRATGGSGSGVEIWDGTDWVPAELIPEPKPVYRQVVDHYVCPLCGERIYRTERITYFPEPDESGAIDTSKPARVVSWFQPCGCEHHHPQED